MDLQYDSQDEVDLSEIKNVRHQKSIVSRFLQFFVSAFYFCFYKVKSIFYYRTDQFATPAPRVQKQGTQYRIRQLSRVNF